MFSKFTLQPVECLPDDSLDVVGVQVSPERLYARVVPRVVTVLPATDDRVSPETQLQCFVSLARDGKRQPQGSLAR